MPIVPAGATAAGSRESRRFLYTISVTCAIHMDAEELAVPRDPDVKTTPTEPADIDRLAAENESLRDRLLRALADAENTRRRAEDRLEDARKFSIADFARELLMVVDNLQRAIAVAENEDITSEEPLIEGVRATLRLFIQTLERLGVRRIEALGRRFDPHLHEAIMVVDDRSHDLITILDTHHALIEMVSRLLSLAASRVIWGELRQGQCG
jgi:molecular chaperone GrpE